MNNLYDKKYNPDVLSCLANLSNDEVFTSPDLVNKILDLLPKDIWQNPNAKFLDPACKSGVFLREIAKRLNDGLKDIIPDLQQRIDHIFKNQLFAIAITELTSLLSRRSVYCSKYPNSPYSVSVFDDIEGNIRFRQIKHSWKNGRCTFCGANERELGDEKRKNLESHAYEFIHLTEDDDLFKRLKDMKFDVIIGNPPYQLSTGSNAGKGSSAIPLYNLFVEQAIKLNPRYITMIIPARWYTGGRGLDNFRDTMLKSKHVRVLCDYYNATECFPGIDLSGGVCYFLWDRDNKGKCKVISNCSVLRNSICERNLLDEQTKMFIRSNKALDIIAKIRIFNEDSFSNFVSQTNPFFLSPTLKPYAEKEFGYIKIYAYPNNGFYPRKNIKNNIEAIDMWKVFVSKAYGERGDFPYLAIGKPFLGEPGSASTVTYLLIYQTEHKEIAENVLKYMKTRFFRFLVLQLKNTQNSTSKSYSLVPIQDFTQEWTDEKLYKKYGLSKEEIDFIESMIKPMEDNKEAE